MAPHALLLAFLAFPRQDPAEAFKKANQALAQGELESAIEQYTRVLEQDPKALGAYINRSTARLRKGDVEGAIEDASRAIKGGSKVPEAFNNRGQAKRLKRDFAGSILDHSLAIVLDPKLVSSYIYRADSKEDSGDVEGALEDCEKALRLSPKSVDALLARARVRALRGDLDKAIEDATRAIEIDPNFAESFARRGRIEGQKGDSVGAIRDLSQAIQLEPQNSRALYFRGLAYRDQNDHWRAVEDFERAFELNSNLSRAPYYLGASYGALKKRDTAIKWLTKALEIGPGDPEVHALRASMYFELGNHEKSLEDCDRALALKPEFPAAVFHRAASLLAKGQWKEAGQDYERYLKLAPEDEDLRDRARAILSLLPELAREASKDPLPIRLLEKARALMDRGELSPAIAILTEVLRLDSKSREAHETIAVAFHKRGDKKRGDLRDALEHVFNVLEFGKEISPELQYILHARGSLVLSGILWLASHQSPDGRWSSDAFSEICVKEGSPRCGGQGRPGGDIQATSLVLLAFLGAGYSQLSKDYYGTKPMGIIVRDGLKWLIAQQNADGSFGSQESERSVENHALAALALCEAYGMTASERLKEPSQRAVDSLLAARLPTKTWPSQRGARETDPSASGWALLALFSAKTAEIPGAEEGFGESLDSFRAFALQGEGAKSDRARFFALAAAGCGGRPQDRQEDLSRLKSLSERPLGQGAQKPEALELFLSTVALRFGDRGELWQNWKKGAMQAVQTAVHGIDAKELCQAGSLDPVGTIEESEGRLKVTALQIMMLEICNSYANCFGRSSATERK